MIFFRRTCLIQDRVVLFSILVFWVSLKISREISLFLIFGAFLSFLWFALSLFDNIIDPNAAIICNNLLELTNPKRQADMVELESHKGRSAGRKSPGNP